MRSASAKCYGIARSVAAISAASFVCRSFHCSAQAASFYDFNVKNSSGKEVALKNEFGKKRVILVTNVASKCGLTQSNYKGLRDLQHEFGERPGGFSVIGFPSDQFMGQEFDTDDKIQEFATSVGANFPIMAKINVNGDSADPLFKWLKSQNWGGQPMESIAWNFAKFLVVDGKVVDRYAPTTLPSTIRSDIELQLAAIESSAEPGSDRDASEL